MQNPKKFPTTAKKNLEKRGKKMKIKIPKNFQQQKKVEKSKLKNP